MYLQKTPILDSLTPFTRLLFSILLVISSFAITFFIGFLLAAPLFGVKVTDISTLLNDVNNDKITPLLQYLQVLQSLGLFIFPALLAGYLFERSSLGYLCLDKPSRWQVYLIEIGRAHV